MSVEILAVGPWQEDQVETRLSHDYDRPPHAFAEELIDRCWEEGQRTARDAGAQLYSSTLCRMGGWRVEGDRLLIDCGFTNYRDFFGTNRVLEDQLRKQLGILNVVVRDNAQGTGNG